MRQIKKKGVRATQEGTPVEDQSAEPLTGFSSIFSLQEYEDTLSPKKEPQLYICDDWIQPVKVMQKTGELQPRDKFRARVAKNCLLVTLMSLNAGYGSLIKSYPPALNSLTEEEAQPIV